MLLTKKKRGGKKLFLYAKVWLFQDMPADKKKRETGTRFQKSTAGKSREVVL